MTTHKKHNEENQPLHIHPGDDEDEEELDGGGADDTEAHDDDGVEVIRPHSHNGIHARKADNIYTRGRGLRDLPVVDERGRAASEQDQDQEADA